MQRSDAEITNFNNYILFSSVSEKLLTDDVAPNGPIIPSSTQCSKLRR